MWGKGRQTSFYGIGKSKAMLGVGRNIHKISACDVNVMLCGESGTGKELAARAIHYQSSRAGQPFIPINCGAIPDNLFENELFGHIKGAFTDAGKEQKGLVTEAENGSLFFDEIGAISKLNQVKLLRLLQDKEYKVLGDSKPRYCNIRVIAATNEDLSKLVEKGTFREDLFYRLNIVTITLPPLKERKEDIPLLAEHFLQKYGKEYRLMGRKLSSSALKTLMAYAWPGNIRELENKIQQALVLSGKEVIEATDFSLGPEGSIITDATVGKLENFKIAKQRIINKFEKSYLKRLLAEFKGDMVQAAAFSGKSRTALWNLLTKHNLHPAEYHLY